MPFEMPEAIVISGQINDILSQNVHKVSSVEYMNTDSLERQGFTNKTSSESEKIRQIAVIFVAIHSLILLKYSYSLIKPIIQFSHPLIVDERRSKVLSLSTLCKFAVLII